MSDARSKVQKLLDQLDELEAKATLVRQEMHAILGGEAGIGEKMRRVERTFGDLWEKRYGTAYVWMWAKDRTLLKKVLATLDADEVLARIVSYLKNDEVFYTRARHPFSLFVQSINNHAGRPAAVTQRPVGCLHEPACRDDAAHTARTHKEMLQ